LYCAPGIYVEEVSTGARPIQAVGTSTAAFVGGAPDATARLDEVLAINWTEFKNGNTSTPPSNAVFGFFENGGRRRYVVNTGKDLTIDGDGRKTLGLRRPKLLTRSRLSPLQGGQTSNRMKR